MRIKDNGNLILPGAEDPGFMDWHLAHIKRHYINLGLMDFKKHLVTSKAKVPFQLENTLETLQKLLKIVNGFINELKPEGIKEKILSIGINLSCRINNTTGYSYSYFHFNKEPLSIIIAKEIGIPTFLENDSQAWHTETFVIEKLRVLKMFFL